MKREREQSGAAVGGPARRRRGRFAKHSGAWKTVEGTEERKTVAKLLQFFQTAARPSPRNSRAAIGFSLANPSRYCIEHAEVRVCSPGTPLIGFSKTSSIALCRSAVVAKLRFRACYCIENFGRVPQFVQNVPCIVRGFLRLCLLTVFNFTVCV
ncbi:hypothetical protein ALC56_06754 [Trachymyrmex septentrionalis]|uniref:Uncharacterized protein n=1 Tax=Trachymyrmex septentrionalis TaxID=34720 RepID=A0A195FDL6_9HYME|nr:hypothetical protein ALC56_06754 [Trachymyrmex septentrionalis]